LPRSRIPRTEVIGEIDFQKDPAPAGFGAGDQTAFRAAADFFRVHVQEGGGLGEIEGLEVSAVGPCPWWFQRQTFMFAIWQAPRTHASASVPDAGCHNQQSDDGDYLFSLAIWSFSG
jgi:hypothetical protein